MSSTTSTSAAFRKHRTLVLRQIRSIREKMQDLDDYLDLLEARACNQGKPTYTTDQVKEILGLERT